jgi:uncharacterized membrane protein
MTTKGLRRVARFAPRRAISRSMVATLVGVATAFLLSRRYALATSILAGWDAGGVVILVLLWLIILSSDSAATQQKAAAEDLGRNAVYGLILLVSTASLLAATVLVRFPKSVAPSEQLELSVLCLLTVGIAWAVTHTAFTLHYAHLYYREGAEGVGGIDFPGDEQPCYFDFAYFSFTLGMCFQVSDATISSLPIRRTALLHATLAFLYNTAILAFVLNLAFGLAG